ncbi:hypothetical protein J7L87_04425 [bacterium]|nr:hypothetical protein [bacterium]
MDKKGKVIFIGDKSSIDFFRVFGMEIFPAETTEEAEEILKKIKISDISVIFITEDVFDRDKFFNLVMDKKMMVLPGLKKREGEGYKIVEELVRKATGMKE